MTPIPGVTKHARERCADHFGRDADRGEWLRVVLAITDRPCGALLMRRGPAPRPGATLAMEQYRVEMHGTPVVVLWNPDEGCVVTVGTPDMDLLIGGLRENPVWMHR